MTTTIHPTRIALFCLALFTGLAASAQIVGGTSTQDDSTPQSSTPVQDGTTETVATAPAGAALTPATAAQAATMRYGYCSRQSLLQTMPEYAKAMLQLKSLREQYEKEALRNETEFRRQYTEYLSGQKDFPQAILLKRQRDLQQSMEQGIAFRAEADSLLEQAEAELMAPLRSRVDAAIRAVATERGYDYVVDTDLGAYVYLNPALSEDITAYVEERLK